MTKWFLGCFLFVCFSMTVEAAQPMQVTHHDVTLTATAGRVNPEERFRGIFLEGSGGASFSLVLGGNPHTYRLHSMHTIEEGFFIVGERMTLTETIQKEVIFFITLSRTGVILEAVYMDDFQADSVKEVIPFKGAWLVLAGRNHYDEDRIIGDEHVLHWYEDGVFKHTFANFGHEINLITVFDDSIGLHRSPIRPYDLLLIDEHTLLSRDTRGLHGIADGATYTGSVNVYFVGHLDQGHKRFTEPFTLDEPGEYTFEYQDQTISFTLHPEIRGIVPGAVMREAVRIEYDKAQAYLNDDLYVSGSLINRPGHHVLRFQNGSYRYEVPFTISANVEGIFDRQTYTDARRITFLGEGYINNTFVESGITLTENGSYTLRVFGDNGYEEQHSFSILIAEETDWLDTWWMTEIVLMGGSLVLGVAILVKSWVKKPSV